ncbi:MAG: phosphoribosylamine--glycine ligase [Treponema sp.]|uniref:phosphoribosylamine--glycine ligase n=1 Tax=Treponema sp. TaxID=166 RepID=UPI001DFAAD53|nr:phosphoribosylamine--glycine ligase [Treponema sp.]MBS7310655.1 phosphoribosylamine--glycine ligase [Treponema sp.]
MVKVIVVGSGGREHTIAWKLAQSSSVDEVICVPGNGGTASENKCRNIPLKQDYITDGANPYVEIAKHEGVTFAVIGPEDPLAAGIADAFWNAGIPCVGPKSAGAQLEASKDLAKEFMAKYNVACPASKTFTDEKSAHDYIDQHGAPIVIKADGLAAGKGVVVAATAAQAHDAVKDLMIDGRVGNAGSKLVIEDYLEGVEISILAAVSVTPDFTKNGQSTIVPFTPARDHKRLFDGAKGPNTGGMGAVTPLDDVTPEIMAKFNSDILEPTLKGLMAEGFDYRGFIFFGVMITKDGPKLLEYNVRLGDPETQVVLPMMDFDFAEMCKAIMDGKLKDFNFAWKKGYAVAPVAVSGGYPNAYKKGIPISINASAESMKGCKIFIAGAIEDRRANGAKGKDLSLITSGGRVLASCAQAATFDEAWNNAYALMKQISFEGMFYRKDIGLPGAAESGKL